MGNPERDVVLSVYRLHDSQDDGSIADLLHPDVVWDSAESYPYRSEDGPWKGSDLAMRSVVEAISDDWIDFTTRIDEIMEVGDRVIVLGRYTGRYKPTGAELDAQVCSIYTVRDGKITKFQQYTDTAQFRAVMGCSFPSAPLSTEKG